ncbi:MAG: amidohydrolase family protein [bacterium]|nr:amidohydrolase family protein [bacterium]
MIDFNVKLGHWPYRPVKQLDALLTQMDRLGIEKAVVSSLHSVFYLNPQDGNEELYAAVAPHADRLMPFAVVKPNFTLCEEDLAKCLGAYGMRGVVLHSNYHRYELDDPALSPLMQLAQEYAVPVCVHMGLEDPRRQYDREAIMPVVPVAIGALAEAYPNVEVVALGLKFGQERLLGDPMPPNVSFDISNYETMGDLASTPGAVDRSRMLFGTGFPMFSMEANVEKLARSGLDDAERQAIARDNAARLLGL